MVVVATERPPGVHFLEGSGVKVGTGILVDEYLRTNVSNIFAAGDCAEGFDINRRGSRINFGGRRAMKRGERAGGDPRPGTLARGGIPSVTLDGDIPDSSPGCGRGVSPPIRSTGRLVDPPASPRAPGCRRSKPKERGRSEAGLQGAIK